ncbi:MAG: alpha/beta hydrolase [Thermodesulfobacteriota bacterium]|nr:alpha/beta hydrolase [Thermodesulfobacteriota bacterium]
MGKTIKRLSFVLLLLCWSLLNTGCSYLVKNEKNQIYSKPKYGEDKFVVVKGHKVHYVEVGEGQPILLIPGAFSTYRGWNRMLPLLSGHYRLLAIDYLGTGDSDKPRSGFGYTIEEQADLIAGMIEELKIIKPHLVGVSYGGGICPESGGTVWGEGEGYRLYRRQWGDEA